MYLILFLWFTPYLSYFYIIFEILFFPFLFYLWTYKNNIKTYHYYYLFYFIGSIFLLYSLLICTYIGLNNYIFINKYQSFSLSLLLFIGFLFKLPIIPFHKWLPLLHTLSPTDSSIILSSLILKLAFFGIYKFIYLKSGYNILIIGFTLYYILILSIELLYKTNIKEIIAYSSIIHMSLLLISYLSFNTKGLILYMIAHGLTSSGLFKITRRNI